MRTFEQPDNREFMENKRRNRFATIDALPAETRALVHEYGYTVVRALLDVGVTRPRNIRHIVETVLNEFSPIARDVFKTRPAH